VTLSQNCCSGSGQCTYHRIAVYNVQYCSAPEKFFCNSNYLRHRSSESVPRSSPVRRRGICCCCLVTEQKQLTASFVHDAATCRPSVCHTLASSSYGRLKCERQDGITALYPACGCGRRMLYGQTVALAVYSCQRHLLLQHSAAAAGVAAVDNGDEK